MNPLSEKYGLGVAVWPRTTFAAKMMKQYLFYKMDV